MAVLIIPTRQDDANYSFQVPLDGVVYTLRLIFNDRDQSWFMTIADSEDNIMRAGIKLVTDHDLLRLWREATRVAGNIIALDTTGDRLRADIDDLGTDVVLTYVEEDTV